MTKRQMAFMPAARCQMFGSSVSDFLSPDVKMRSLNGGILLYTWDVEDIIVCYVHAGCLERGPAKNL
jgi:hypothetical protein